MKMLPALVLSVISLVCVAPAARSASSKPGLPLSTNCVLILQIVRGDSPWLDMTGSYAQEQSNKLIRAVAPSVLTNFTPLSSLALYDQPDMLLGRSTERQQVIVNDRYFSELHRGDATRLPMGQTQALGTFRDLAFHRLSPRDLVLFLINAQIIETYWHLEARLCLVREEDRAGVYRAWFTGVHTYCTNDCQDELFAFIVEIDIAHLTTVNSAR